MAKNKKAVENLVKGLSGAAITATAELIKKNATVKKAEDNLKKKKENKERTRELPKLNKLTPFDKNKHALENGGKVAK